MKFYKIEVAGSFLPDGTRKIGDVGSEFSEIHSDDFFGDLTGNVTGDLTGNVTGDVTGDVTGNLNGDVYTDNGLSVVLDNGGNTPANATFTGIAERAKYA